MSKFKVQSAIVIAAAFATLVIGHGGLEGTAQFVLTFAIVFVAITMVASITTKAKSSVLGGKRYG